MLSWAQAPGGRGSRTRRSARSRLSGASVCLMRGDGSPCPWTAMVAWKSVREGATPSNAHTRGCAISASTAWSRRGAKSRHRRLNKAEEAVAAATAAVSPAKTNQAPKARVLRDGGRSRALASSASRRSSPSQMGSSGSCARPPPAPPTRRRLWSPAVGQPCEASAGASGASCPGGRRSFHQTTTPDGTSSGAAPPGWRAATAGPTTGGGRRSTRSSRPSGGRRSSKGGFKAAFRREIAPD